MKATVEETLRKLVDAQRKFIVEKEAELVEQRHFTYGIHEALNVARKERDEAMEMAAHFKVRASLRPLRVL